MPFLCVFDLCARGSLFFLSLSVLLFVLRFHLLLNFTRCDNLYFCAIIERLTRMTPSNIKWKPKLNYINLNIIYTWKSPFLIVDGGISNEKITCDKWQTSKKRISNDLRCTIYELYLFQFCHTLFGLRTNLITRKDNWEFMAFKIQWCMHFKMCVYMLVIIAAWVQ